MVIDQLLCSHAVYLVHEALLVGEEVVQFVTELTAQQDAALVALIKGFNHCGQK